MKQICKDNNPDSRPGLTTRASMGCAGTAWISELGRLVTLDRQQLVLMELGKRTGIF